MFIAKNEAVAAYYYWKCLKWHQMWMDKFSKYVTCHV